MLKVHFHIEPHYRLDRKLIRNAAQITAARQNLKTEAEMTVSIIGDRKMKALNRDFRGQDKTTNVLSFTASEVSKIPHFQSPLEQNLYIGDVAVSYPVALEEAIKENTLVDERIAFLVVHGMLHLFGLDHEQLDEARVMEDMEDSIMTTLKTPQLIK
jgi:probable rRNA maturation factor